MRDLVCTVGTYMFGMPVLEEKITVMHADDETENASSS
jgi:hypothetical protein